MPLHDEEDIPLHEEEPKPKYIDVDKKSHQSDDDINLKEAPQ